MSFTPCLLQYSSQDPCMRPEMSSACIQLSICCGGYYQRQVDECTNTWYKHVKRTKTVVTRKLSTVHVKNV